MMLHDRKHQSFLEFVRRVLSIPLGYSKEDLAVFRSAARREQPWLTSLIEDYIRLAERSDTDVAVPPRSRSRRVDPSQMHLFDLLRQKRLFPLNSDLSEFAGSVLPTMDRHRFDKMSRGDIAARIIEYLEKRDPRTREELETSMRDALGSGQAVVADRKSFLSKWERIIKGIEL